MRLANLATLAAMAVSIVSTSASAATVRASDASPVSVSSGITPGVLNSSHIRAGKKTGQDQALLGAPLFLLFLGAVAITIGTIVIVNDNGSN